VTPKAQQVETSPLDRVRQLVREINKRAKADETVEDIIVMSKSLLELFGCRRRRPEPNIEGLLTFSKREYLSLGIKKVGYSWVRKLIKVAMDPKLTNPDIWHRLPAGRQSMIELSKLPRDRFEQGINPDPESDGEIFITPSTGWREIKKYGQRGQPIKPIPEERYVAVAIPIGYGCGWEDALSYLQESIWDADCDMMLARVRKKQTKMRMFGVARTADPSPDASTGEGAIVLDVISNAGEITEKWKTTWTLEQIEIRRKPKDHDA
jgi:hypothetical protein